MFGLGAMMTQNLLQKSIIISSNTNNWDLITDGFGGVTPSRKIVVNLTVNNAIVVGSSSTATPAMDLTGLPEDSVINLTNLGTIAGRGGDGGDGSDLETDSEGGCSVLTQNNGQDGSDGGDAIEYDGTNVDLNLTNAAGEIFAGGGGSGGGGSCFSSGTCNGNAGGGGGGGAGGSVGGSGGSATRNAVPIVNGDGSNGAAGGTGSSGAGGSGGAGGTNSACSGKAGGDGGDYGEDGVAGTGGGNGNGGSAGLAVKKNGTGTTTFVTGGVEGTDYKGTVQ